MDREENVPYFCADFQQSDRILAGNIMESVKSVFAYKYRMYSALYVPNLKVVRGAHCF